MGRKKTVPEDGMMKIETPEAEATLISVVMKKTVILNSMTYENGKTYEVEPSVYKLLSIFKAVR